MKSFNGVELVVGQRVITNEDDECFTEFVWGTITDVHAEVNHPFVSLDVDCDNYGRTRAAADLIVIKEDK